MYNGMPSITRNFQPWRSVGLARVIVIEGKREVSDDTRHLKVACSRVHMANGTTRNWSHCFHVVPLAYLEAERRLALLILDIAIEFSDVSAYTA